MRGSFSLRKRRRILALLIVLALALAAGWDVASPWLTLKAMRDAARARDSEKLASYIDFAKLRANLNDEVAATLEARAPPHSFETWTAKFGVAFVVRPIVDFIVSPKALQIALLTAPPKGADARTQQCGVKRDGLNHFRLRCAKLPNGEGELIFERRGLGWVLVGIDLPKDYGAAIP